MSVKILGDNFPEILIECRHINTRPHGLAELECLDCNHIFGEY